jgi:hypothetical protein
MTPNTVELASKWWFVYRYLSGAMLTGFGGHVPKSLATQSRGQGTPLPEDVTFC